MSVSLGLVGGRDPLALGADLPIRRDHPPEREHNLQAAVPVSTQALCKGRSSLVAHGPSDAPESVKEDVVAGDDAPAVAEHVPDRLVRDVVIVALQTCG